MKFENSERERVRPFFITGLPRSRTAWLANLFTTDTTLCVHEPTSSLRILIEWSPKDLRMGVSDASLTLRWDELRQAYPLARWLYVERKEEEAMDSLRRFIRGQVETKPNKLRAFLERHQDCARRMREDGQVQFVKFEELDKPMVIRDAWKWLLPETEFSWERWRMLLGLNVQQSAAGFRERVTARHD